MAGKTAGMWQYSATRTLGIASHRRTICGLGIDKSELSRHFVDPAVSEFMRCLWVLFPEPA